MDTEDGEVFIKSLAYFVRTHEKALANALQLQRQTPKHGQGTAPSQSSPTSTNATSSSSSSVWASALSLPSLKFTSTTLKPAKLTLTPHHLFYLLSRFEELGIEVGPMNVRLENIHTDAHPANYVSFLSSAQRNKSRSSDRDSMHSVSSIRSVMSSMSSLWSSLRLSSNSAAKAEKQKAAIQEDLKYLFSAFTKIPCLRLAPDHRAKLIAGYEEFPFDSAVPLFAFKNVTALEIYDVDFRQFYGWDRLAENLRSLTVKRAGVDDPADLLIHIVLDDMDKRRRRSAKVPPSPSVPYPSGSPTPRHAQLARSQSPPTSPGAVDKQSGSPNSKAGPRRQRSTSPIRPHSSRHGSVQGYGKNSAPNLRRSSGSSSSSIRSATPRGSSPNLLSLGWFPSTKWRFLRHLSLADNALTNISATSLAPLANTLQSLDLSSNLFVEIPDSLATLSCLRALNLSNCMIASLHSLTRNPLPAITTLNLRSNRLTSLAGIERIPTLERVDVRDNKLMDPTEIARLTGVPDSLREVYVNRNPFCKAYPNYRVTIFNLFRKTPGYTEDIIIDTEGPRSSERKQLVDRAPELPNPPVMKPPPEEEAPAPYVPPKVIIPIDNTAPAINTPRRMASHHRSKSGFAGSHKKKKPAKRRVVELSQRDSFQSDPEPALPSTENPLATVSHAAVAPPTSEPAAQVRCETTPLVDESRTAIGASHSSQCAPVEEPFAELPARPTKQERPPIDKSSPQPPTHAAGAELDVGSDLYKKKIEALRQDLGPNWLSALGDDGWDNPTVTPFHEGTYTSPGMTPGLHRTPSQGIVSGGRTLG
ncbi:uncharacterized protein EI97DRAFT_103424 [Westerdykella ornata]|uniref:NXF1/2/3/5-like leucine-rich repeat domain-containing protein n=1 Tax=Westerdykella ornata TaxID=318751 RepID=A0A6A6JE99_WESOR|nr:uncharacterized protein EI97DRAFT_103424 [Westerdykella ornata]KAF2274595.1 hypothetical protein EI97DRAFT_103424 [Westerdykella ornata]